MASALAQALSDKQFKKLGVVKSDMRRIRTTLDGHSQVRPTTCSTLCLESRPAAACEQAVADAELVWEAGEATAIWKALFPTQVCVPVSVQ